MLTEWVSFSCRSPIKISSRVQRDIATKDKTEILSHSSLSPHLSTCRERDVLQEEAFLQAVICRACEKITESFSRDCHSFLSCALLRNSHDGREREERKKSFRLIDLSVHFSQRKTCAGLFDRQPTVGSFISYTQERPVISLVLLLLILSLFGAPPGAQKESKERELGAPPTSPSPFQKIHLQCMYASIIYRHTDTSICRYGYPLMLSHFQHLTIYIYIYEQMDICMIVRGSSFFGETYVFGCRQFARHCNPCKRVRRVLL